MSSPHLSTAARKEQKPSSEVCVRLGVIGFGYWGPNLVRNFQNHSQSKVVAVADLEEDRLKPLAKRYPDVQLTRDFQTILKNNSIDAVAIATPVSTHYALTKAALKAGKHVLVEKPLAASSREGLELHELARSSGKILMVGHTFEFNPAVVKIAELLKADRLGNLHYIDSVRVNLGRYQADGGNVIWDLGPHDISIILHWVGRMPERVSAWGRAFIKRGVEDIAFIRLEFPDQVLAHINLSWLAPAKIRRMTVVGSKQMVLYDDLENLEKIKIVDRSPLLDPQSAEVRVDYRMGDIVSPHLDFKEPLALECTHFIHCILQNQTPRTDGENGVRVVRILEAADQSLKKGGEVIDL